LFEKSLGMSAFFGRDRSASGAFFRRLLAFVSGLLIAQSAGALLYADEAADQYNLAAGLYKQSRWQLSVDAFRTFLKDHPQHDKASFAELYLGLALVNLEEYREARQVLREYVERYPQSKNRPDALYRVAESSYLLDDLRAAEPEFRTFLEAYPEHELLEWALPYYGDVLLRVNKPEEAVAVFKKSLELYPEAKLAEDARFSLARAYETLKQNEAAIEVYLQLAANRAGARAAQSQLNLGALYFEAKRFAEAAQAYSQLEARFPESPLVALARLNAGYSYYQSGDYQRAADSFRLAAEDSTQATTANYWQALSYKVLGDFARAVEILKSALQSDPNSPLAINLEFQQAACELRLGHADAARRFFLAVVDRQPQGEMAADSLHFAAEAALLSQQLDEAQALLDRFAKDFPRSPLALPNRLLRGRLLAARGGEANLTAAIAEFEAVLKESRIPHTQSLARFYQARTLHKTDEHARALKVLEPLLVELRKDSGAKTPEWSSVLVLAGESQLALKEYDAAVASTTLYLDRQPAGAEADQALATRALAALRTGDLGRVQSDLKLLSERFAESAIYPATLHQIAEQAYEAGQWALAAEAFAALLDAPDTSRHAAALSGRAWALYKLQQYEAAAELFARVVSEYSHQRQLAAEAAYQRGRSLQELKQLADAAVAYEQALQAFAPDPPADSPPTAGAPEHFAFLAGLQAARVLRLNEQIEASDAAYASLLKAFPRPKELDKLLDEWALLNYENGRFDRADEIFRRLASELPQSDLADNARLSLAESDLVKRQFEPAAKEFEALVSASGSDAKVREVALYHLVEIGVEQDRWRDVQKQAERFLEQFAESEYRAETEFWLAEALINLDRIETAQQHLLKLKPEFAAPADAEAPWVQRIWVLLAETYCRQKKYREVEQTVAEFRSRFADSPIVYQTDEIVGRMLKNQAQFEQARAAFQRALDDPHSHGTETAAKCQLLIAETYMFQEQYEAAQREYLKVYHLHKFPAWQAPALFQAGMCDEALQQWQAAVQTYESLVSEFADSEFAEQARARLKTARQRARG
jgi:TolA-binding protein